jgi:hypothetical protein
MLHLIRFRRILALSWRHGLVLRDASYSSSLHSESFYFFNNMSDRQSCTELVRPGAHNNWNPHARQSGVPAGHYARIIHVRTIKSKIWTIRIIAAPRCLAPLRSANHVDILSASNASIFCTFLHSLPWRRF